MWLWRTDDWDSNIFHFVSNGKFFMQMHIEVSEHVSLEESHNIADQVEENILNKFPDAEIILHVDPSNVIEEKEFVDA